VRPARGIVVLKPIETPETIGQGKIILTPATREAMTTHQLEVVSVGYPAQCQEFPDCERPHVANLHAPIGKFPKEPHFHPHGLKAGDWVLVRHRSLLETHQEGLYCTHQDDVLAILSASL